ncbi:hypothetical protein AHAS_Ahas18G0183200 [Arachis hypogaea]
MNSNFWCQVPMDSTIHSKEMKLLGCGPMLQARRFGAYNINGYKFRTITKEDRLKTENSGVFVSSNTRSYVSVRDNRVDVGSVLYYGKIGDIIELNYSCHFTVASNKTTWALPALISLVRLTPMIEKRMNRTYWHQKLILCAVYVMK